MTSQGPYREPSNEPEPEVTWRAPVAIHTTWWAAALAGLAFAAFDIKVFRELGQLEAGQRTYVLTDPFTDILYRLGGRLPALLPMGIMATLLFAVAASRFFKRRTES